jgi:maltooligosyltrehalose trehalohydrolase
MSELAVNERTLGINFSTGGEASVRVWAPQAHTVEVALPGLKLSVPLEPEEFGYWHTRTYQIEPGDLYKVVLNNEKERPDPASLFQPEGVHGPSQAYDLKNFKWSDGSWQNPALEKYILYELHTGTFTPEGTFAGLA